MDSYDTDNGATNGDGKFINIERVAIGRGFLPVVFDCDRGNSIPQNIEDLSYALKGLLKNEK
ncbi:hypothetical protein [Campylobacter rectus]|uniref:hypothetical protein n=1 Tax=Campylobacter rectus TaxID=203 RepID=UPI0028DD28D1|nr:hypothetical protein [Campylobacter rectus]